MVRLGRLLGETGPQKRGSHERIKVCERARDKPREGGPLWDVLGRGMCAEDPDEDKKGSEGQKRLTQRQGSARRELRTWRDRGAPERETDRAEMGPNKVNERGRFQFWR